MCYYGWDEVDANVVCQQLGLDNEVRDKVNTAIHSFTIIVYNTSFIYYHYNIIALPVNTSRFEAGDGPILLDNVACNKSHSNLSQCVHPLDIGIQEYEEGNIAGVICLNISSTEVTNTPVMKYNGADIKVNSNKSQSALFGSVGAALAVGAIVTVAVVGIAVLLGTKQKKRRSVSLLLILSV